MGLFSKKKKDEIKEPETAPVAPAEEAKKPAAPSVRNVKVPAKTEAAPEKAAKPAAKSAPASVKTVKSAPAAKPAAKKDDVTAVPATASRPFFMKTDDDLRAAFDEAIAAADEAIARNGAKAVGKYEFELQVDGYHFYLVANNGQVLFDSPSFTTLIGALKGIETFRKAVATGNFAIRTDKYNRYRFILDRKYYGENYETKDRCQKSVESVKNFAENSKVIRYTPEKASVAAFEAAKNTKRTADDVNWKLVAEMEAAAQKMGKFEISKEEDEYAFYLLANNGQILYASRCYANEAACRRGIESFKRAAYVANFFIDKDKFGHFRYVLKNLGSAPSFIGESYDSKAQCEKIIDSVKKFIVSAAIVVDEESK